MSTGVATRWTRAASRDLASPRHHVARSGGWALLGLCLCTTATARAEPTTLGLALHVAVEDGAAVVGDDFIERQLTRANEIFAPYEVRFRRASVEALAGHARMETRADRDALGAYATHEAGAIHCFLVRSLRDVDEPERMRRGVHWHSRSHPGAHYVIVSSIAFDAVLAHELGHFLGNPRHSKTAGNLMSYAHTDVLPFLDAAQQARMRRRLRRYLASGELVALPADRASPDSPAEGEGEGEGAAPQRAGSEPCCHGPSR